MRNALLICLLLVSAFFVIPACGGGSHGTGTLTIEGRVLDSLGGAFSNAQITNLESGAAAVTDSDGAFLMETERLSGAISFLIEKDDLSVTSEGSSQVSSVDDSIEVNITVDTSTGAPSANQEVKVKPRPSQSSSSSSSANSQASSSSSANSSSQSSSSQSSTSSSSQSNSSSSSFSSSSSSSEEEDDDDDEHSSSSANSSSSSSSSQSSQSSSSSSSSSEDDAEVRVVGPIQNLTSQTATVQGTTFTVNASTDFGNREALADFSVGEVVEVRGSFVQGVLIAERFRLD